MRRRSILVVFGCVLLASLVSTTVAAQAGVERPFRRGDANCDGFVDGADAVASLYFMFSDGDPLCCLDAADVDDDGMVDIPDVAFLLNFLTNLDPEVELPAPGSRESAGAEAPSPGAGVLGSRRRSVRDEELEARLLRAAGVLSSLRGWVVFLSVVIVLALVWSFSETRLQARHFQGASRSSAVSVEPVESEAWRAAEGGLGEAAR